MALDVAAPVDNANVVRSALARLNRRLRAREEPGGLGSTALSVLGRLHRDGPMSMGELAAEERLQPQSLTRTVADLERRAFVTRTADERDRRRARVALTEAGLERLIALARRRNAWLARVMASELTAPERALLAEAARLLDRLADADADADAGAEA